MSEDREARDSDAQESRAERLREEIERLRRGDGEVGADAPRSPREFIEERMRELDDEADDEEP